MSRVLCPLDRLSTQISTRGRGVRACRDAAPVEPREQVLVPGDDRVLGAIASTGDRDLMTVETSRGGEQTISTAKYEVTGRGGKGRELMQRGGFTRVIPGEVPLPVLPERE